MVINYFLYHDAGDPAPVNPTVGECWDWFVWSKYQPERGSQLDGELTFAIRA
jgi:hypothetical protein